MTHDEIEAFFMSHHQYATYVSQIDELSEMDWRTQQSVESLLSMDKSIREAESQSLDATALLAKRIAKVKLLDRDALSYLCAIYHAAPEEEPLKEYDFYSEWLSYKDRKKINFLRINLDKNQNSIMLCFYFDLDGRVSRIESRYGTKVRKDSKTDGLDWAKIDDLIYLCDFTESRLSYGNPYDCCDSQCNNANWTVFVKFPISHEADGTWRLALKRSEGFGVEVPAQWCHVEALVRELYRKRCLLKMPEMPQSFVDCCNQKAQLLLAFHKAFWCNATGEHIRWKGDYGVLQLHAGKDTGIEHPEIKIREKEWYGVPPAYSFGEGNADLPASEEGSATGFAIFKGTTLVFIFLGCSNKDVVRLLRRFPVVETEFTRGKLSLDQAMQKVKMVLSTTALFVHKVSRPTHAIFGHQPGIPGAGCAYLKRDLSLDYMMLPCNSDGFDPRFVQTLP